MTTTVDRGGSPSSGNNLAIALSTPMTIPVLVSVNSNKASRGIDLIAPQGIPAFCCINQERTLDRLAYIIISFFIPLYCSCFSKRSV